MVEKIYCSLLKNLTPDLGLRPYILALHLRLQITLTRFERHRTTEQ